MAPASAPVGSTHRLPFVVFSALGAFLVGSAIVTGCDDRRPPAQAGLLPPFPSPPPDHQSQRQRRRVTHELSPYLRRRLCCRSSNERRPSDPLATPGQTSALDAATSWAADYYRHETASADPHQRPLRPPAPPLSARNKADHGACPPASTFTRHRTTSSTTPREVRGEVSSFPKDDDTPTLPESLFCCAPQSRRDPSIQRWPGPVRRPHLPRRQRSVSTKRPAAVTYVHQASSGCRRSRGSSSFGNRSI
jgi:hypothetical protein